MWPPPPAGKTVSLLTPTWPAPWLPYHPRTSGVRILRGLLAGASLQPPEFRRAYILAPISRAASMVSPYGVSVMSRKPIW